MQDADDEVVQSLRKAEIESAPIPENEKALLRFVRLLTNQAYKTTQQEIDDLREQGWTDEQIGEGIYIAALFAFFNRVADGFGLEDPCYKLPT